MNPTIRPGSPPAISSGHFLHCSVLSRNMGYSHNIIPSWERDVPCTIPRMKPRHRLVNFSAVQRSRCQSVSLAFKRHLESKEQEPRSKHFLSEEKMAARFNSLSLDNDHIYCSNGFPVHSENPRWQQAYTQLKELQRRLSQDGASEGTNSTEEELTTVIVDGEFMMGDCPMLVPSSFTLEGLEGSSIAPEEMLLSLNPSTEIVLWSPHTNSLLHTIRTLMTPSPVQPHLEAVANQEEMEV
ncbi:PREDICTED: host cell factor C1 regulator 1 isoform X1 [Thamnophis sirtalis]|uniref:Host cell factor C1 regulator 1 isoform X1 n=1 Tax=Thamnophis sirtalis TaxID=35019 RepID=A0A6I9Y789_9SAUR|nr:PREDICTED: host cell factor C1 regulator 1 isoform X1 [Thamnophis sirtalis]XP_013914756.1 PREDICTED: host cell factor C1 regulator 1 isoform X1 [Thamnophis sirtalis]XP_013914757.1 PREDICTED: host cell factor C1 regulator 1 isoform X1 [Thamnophis sirtalis]XP_013914758.1 PREDICTED: host cell factor C1 regulator 1 isoform X1 [Thamnophis sirtalis]